MNLGDRAWQLMLDLTKFHSISQSPGESRIAREIHSRLANLPYFQLYPSQLRLQPIAAPNNPAVVAALVRGKGRTGIILLNHHDVVDIEDYGIYKKLAFAPLELTRSLDPGILPPAARGDLLRGDWVFGRGTMDMLYGLALQQALTEAKAASGDFAGNILFVSVPDEENNSLGMRHAIGVIREFQQEYGLDFAAAVNCEPHGYDGEDHVIQTGSDGKLLPLICCFGRETHAGALYDGLNPYLLLAEVIRMLELNPGFSDACAGEYTYPPTVLRGGDLKKGYNVSTPPAAWACFNIFTLAASPREIMAKLVRLCQQAVANGVASFHRSAAAWQSISGTNLTLPEIQPQVLTFSDLWQQCLRAHGESFVREIDSFAAQLVKKEPDLQRLTLELIQRVHRYSPDDSPKIVIALAPPFYPPVRNRRQTEKELRVMAAVKNLQNFAREKGVDLGHKEYHRGISDLSYCLLQDAGEVVDTLKANCPLWDRGYHLPLEDLAALDAPAVNLGPWGRDLHKFTERIHAPFAKEMLPQLLTALVENLLTQNK
jgi:arginine utilization protein RocB